jgi:hypothetical protein
MGFNKVDGTMMDSYFEQMVVKAKLTGKAVSMELLEKKKSKDDNYGDWKKKSKKMRALTFNALLKKGDRIKVWWQEDKKWYFGKVVRESR